MAPQRVTRSKTGIVQKSRRLLEAEEHSAMKASAPKKAVPAKRKSSDTVTKSPNTRPPRKLIPTAATKNRTKQKNKQPKLREKTIELDINHTKLANTPSNQLNDELIATVRPPATAPTLKSAKRKAQVLKVQTTKSASSTRQSRKLKAAPHKAGCIGLSPKTRKNDFRKISKLNKRKLAAVIEPKTPDLSERLVNAMLSPVTHFDDKSWIRYLIDGTNVKSLH